MGTLATKEGTERYAGRFSPQIPPSHYRSAFGLKISSIGMGTYLGGIDDATDRRYKEAALRAVGLGCNMFDTAINYRFQRSERALGAAFKEMWDTCGVGRDELFVATKGGYIPFDGAPPQDATQYIREQYLDTGVLSGTDEVVRGAHCMAPSFLKNQFETSLSNLGLDAVDLYYIHNPEEQLYEVERDTFMGRIEAAFALLERFVSEGRLRFYGVATWSGFREDPNSPFYLSLSDLSEVAKEVGGDEHHMRFVQLPFNLAMPEALVSRNQMVNGTAVSLLEAAWELGIHVVASSTLLQSQLTTNLPSFISTHLEGLRTDAQRAIQFTRSIPGITSSLVGMSSPQHIDENMEVATKDPATIEALANLFSDARSKGG